MGFEVVFHYLNKKDEGGYDIANPQQFTKSLGNGAEDVPLDKLVGLVMSQYARRDVMVNDVEVYETVKRKIAYKETAGGVIIKNKKYSFDQGVINIVGEVATPESQECPTEVAYEKIEEVKQEIKSKVAKRWEVFNPESDLVNDLKRKGIALTVGKQYPIMDEKVAEQVVNTPHGSQSTPTLLYQVIGDHGKPVIVHSIHFSSAQAKGLYGYDYGTDEVVNAVQPHNSQAKLLYVGNNNVEMPVLRR